jgi:hypothetical protein
VRGELVPGPGPFELEILDADPRRVKKLRIYRSHDRLNGKGRDARPLAVGSAPPPPPEPPATRAEAAKLSSDAASSKSPRRP